MRFRFINGALPSRHGQREITDTVDHDQTLQRVIRAVIASEGMCDASTVHSEPNQGERTEGWESHVISADGFGPIALIDAPLEQDASSLVEAS